MLVGQNYYSLITNSGNILLNKYKWNNKIRINTT